MKLIKSEIVKKGLKTWGIVIFVYIAIVCMGYTVTHFPETKPYTGVITNKFSRESNTEVKGYYFDIKFDSIPQKEVQVTSESYMKFNIGARVDVDTCANPEHGVVFFAGIMFMFVTFIIIVYKFFS